MLPMSSDWQCKPYTDADTVTVTVTVTDTVTVTVTVTDTHNDSKPGDNRA